MDGTKINLPKELQNNAYKKPSDSAHYPQGLVSCLYQLKSEIPYDFELAAHVDERALALKHLQILNKDDIVVYDRGYFSYPIVIITLGKIFLNQTNDALLLGIASDKSKKIKANQKNCFITIARNLEALFNESGKLHQGSHY